MELTIIFFYTCVSVATIIVVGKIIGYLKGKLK